MKKIMGNVVVVCMASVMIAGIVAIIGLLYWLDHLRFCV